MPYDFYRQQCPANFSTYIIQPGDTLYRIAYNYGVSISSIIAANPGIRPELLIIGSDICIPSSCPPNNRIYRIESGDTLYSIAVRFYSSVQSIMTANPGLDPYYLRVGQLICIPPACPPRTFLYIVQRGDTLSLIAKKYHVTVNMILSTNPEIRNPNELFIGQKLCIPVLTQEEG